MGIESDAERAIFFTSTDFADEATYTPAGGSAATVAGIFDKDYSLADFGSMGVGSNDPRFSCQTSDVPAAASGDQIVVRSITYLIRHVENDGTGITNLVLEA
jgi:hypothetical protein|tara:strand:- start:761 stop:1066 length:306 start_codon:yes stop_codon:yes gene_type:complete